MKKIQLVSILLLSSIVGLNTSLAGVKDDKAGIKAMLAEKMPDLKVTEVNKTAVPGLYEVIMPPRIFYASADARYLFTGDMIQVSSGENVTSTQRDKVRADAVEQLGEGSMIIFAPKKVKHTITVFTDIDCGYCRKLHNEMAKYNEKGIKVRYLAFPRAGIGSASFKKAEAVWCAKDRNQAMDQAKSGKTVATKTCDNPIRKHYKLGEMIGVRGTPAIMMESGQLVPGYVPADRLYQGLEEQKKAIN